MSGGYLGTVTDYSLLREDATVTAFKRIAPVSNVIHLSSHGYFDPWIPMRSGLVLFGGDREILRAREIQHLDLSRTRLVVMSACVSSVGDLSGGDEATGLTRAFLSAGVGNVIGSLWNVANNSTTRLMTFFYEELKKMPHDPVQALCAAQRRAMKIDPDPAHWAAFQVFSPGKSYSHP
jgi:CHAT domain-containing protein